MACPYFCPTHRLEEPAWRSKIRPPLGDVYHGECHARPGQVHQPLLAMIETCNLGYAAGQCDCFPAGGGPDAVRFCVHEDNGTEVSVDYVLERAHLPHSHGRIIYDRSRNGFPGLQDGGLLQHQAKAYVQSYLDWKHDSRTKAKRQAAAAKG